VPRPQRPKKIVGPGLVALASVLWATDSLVRFPSVGALDPTFIVLVEHLIAVALLLPWALKRGSGLLFNLNWKEWLAAAFAGIGGSALALILFTASFRYVNPSITILLQKLQPILVVLIAAALLGERPGKRFYLGAPIALAAAIVLSFPDLDFGFLSDKFDVRSRGVFYALFSCSIWAVATVAGRLVLLRQSPMVASFWRYAFGLGGLLGLSLLGNVPMAWGQAFTPPLLYSMTYMAVIPGLLAMICYYAGLSRTPASIATFAELLFPVGAVILNTLFLHTPLNHTQMIAGGVLLAAVTLISTET